MVKILRNYIPMISRFFQSALQDLKKVFPDLLMPLFDTIECRAVLAGLIMNILMNLGSP